MGPEAENLGAREVVVRPHSLHVAPFDVVVVGLGPAGAAALSQARRDGLNALGVGDEPVGGLVWAARRIENLPALGKIASGAVLASRLWRHIEQCGASVQRTRIERVERTAGVFICAGAGGRMFCARALILATGTRPSPWDIGLESDRIHRDARTLPRTLDRRSVMVVGGGEAALDSALTAADRGARVRMLVRADRLKAPAPLADQARRARVRVTFGARVISLDPGRADLCIMAQSGRGRRVLRCHHLLVCIGREPRRELALPLIPRLPNELPISGPLPGLFFAGDVRGRNMRFCAQALADGQAAAIAARTFLEEGSHG